MAEGQKALETWASVDMVEPSFRSTELDSDLFVIGNITVAVMVKQAFPEGSRLHFRAALGLLLTLALPTESCPTPQVDIDKSVPVDSELDMVGLALVLVPVWEKS
jgi:hypothetical protein